MPTTLIAPSPALRHALLADAATSGGAGALHLAGGAALATQLGLPQALMFDSGLFMLAHAAALVGLTRAPTLRTLWVAIVVAGNFAWADACIALWAFDVVTPTPLGTAWLLLQATAVTALALWQGIGWRASKRLQAGGATLQRA